jgi:hypothetical protein
VSLDITKRRWFQFSFSDLLFCVFYFGCAFALGAAVVPLYQSESHPNDRVLAFAAFLGPFAVGALAGTAVGQLFGDAKTGAIIGVIATVAFAFIRMTLGGT